jgi:transcriptional regulator with XRE-family HTH domain
VTVHQAVRALRRHAGKSQQVFATELGMSISALSNYERRRVPEPRQLLVFQKAAEVAERRDLAQVFRDQLKKALPQDWDKGTFAAVSDFENLVLGMVLVWLRAPDKFRDRGARALMELIATELRGLGGDTDEAKDWFFTEARRLGLLPPANKEEEE